MSIAVFREACCAQDDQLGPLDVRYDLDEDATLRELIDQVVASRFLQYSSSHTVMVGAFGETAVARVFGPDGAGRRETEFLAAADRRVADLAAGRPLRFRFTG